jgi:hypothetical protein
MRKTLFPANVFKLIMTIAAALMIAVPAAAQVADRFTAGGSAVTFPVEIHGWLVYVPVEINGRHLKFVLDSGASRNLLDFAVMQQLGLKPVGDDGTHGAGRGRVSLKKLGAVEMRLPKLEMHFDEAAAVDLMPVSRDVGVTLDGLLGYPFLSRYVVTIDYERSTMTVTAPEKFGAPAGAAALPLELRGKWPFVAGEVKPSEDVTIQDKFLVDSGSGDGVDHPIVLQMQANRATRTGMGLGKATTGAINTLWGFRLGPYLLHDVTGVCCGGSEDTSRMFGGQVLRYFTVTFDYPHQRMFLVPNRAYSRP